MTNQSQPEKQVFSFVWNGGFSYLTYLKKTSHVSITDEQLIVQSRNHILGAFPTKPKNEQWPLSSISDIRVGLKLNWFDLVFALLFATVGLATIKFWPLLLTAIFLLRCFNTSITITNQQNRRLAIRSGSRNSANLFVDKLAQQINQQRDAIQADEKQVSETLVPIIPIKSSNKLKTVGLIVSAATIALLILTISILSKGGLENKYIQWVKEGTAPGSNLKMAQVLENPAFFSNIEWKEVEEEGNTLDKFVMYQSTLSDQGVKVSVRTIFQVFGGNHYEAVETSSDGDILPTSDWYVFLADMTDRYQNGNTTKGTLETNEPQQAEDASPPVQPVSTTENKVAEPSNSAPTLSDEMNLSRFTKWSPSEPDITLPLELEGEKVDLLVGQDDPNGIKALALSASLGQGWPLTLLTNSDGGTPFDEFGDLKEGFNLYIKSHDFGSDGVPEIVVSTSDGLLETYVWVFAYNFVFTENDSSPLDLIWFGEGQSDVILEGNKILLPFGSQGLFDEYVYSNNTFAKH